MHRLRRLFLGVTTALLVSLAAGCAERPAGWAQRVERPGLRNCRRVDDGLYRSARLSAAGVSELKALGIRTVITLRPEDNDEKLLAGSGIALVRQGCLARALDEDDLVEFLRLATDPERRPVLVHCWAGADRTGAMVAAYRVAVQNWSREEAAREMQRGGYSFHGLFNANLVRLINSLDVERLRREAGLTADSSAEPQRNVFQRIR